MTTGVDQLRIVHGDCLDVLADEVEGWARLAYLDPPFNTGRRRTGGRRIGGAAPDARPSYGDAHGDYLGFLMPRVDAVLRCLTPDGSLFLHLDWRESHYVKVALDARLGRDAFMNEIIWAYDFGGRPRRRWAAKHDVILWYVRDPEHYVFDEDAVDRIPYMAPGLAGPEKAARGKRPTDVWWHTIVPTAGSERTGYPTQKPLGVLERIVRVHSARGDTVLDPFAGSGTTGEAALRHGRQALLVDANAEAVAIMRRRLAETETGLGAPRPEERGGRRATGRP